LFYHPWPRNRDNEPAATPPILGQLRHDLVCYVPGQKEHIVRLGLQQPLGRRDRQMDAGKI
jgi:hypothetical protein